MTTSSAELAPASGAAWPWLQSAVQMAEICCRSWSAEPAADADGWSAMPKVATRTPAANPHSVATARAFTLRTMHKWGAVGRAEDAAAVMSELLTNALRHAVPRASQAAGEMAAWPIRIGLLHPGPYVVCAVADPSTDIPVRREPDWLDESGRGLQVVASLSDQWGYCPAPADLGKVVWAAFALAAGPYR